MSVLVTIWVPADVEEFRKYVAEHEDRFRAISERSRSMGCQSHRFAVSDTNLLVVDEWESGEQFQKFFDDPEIASVMQESGLRGEPNIAILEALDTPDQF